MRLSEKPYYLLILSLLSGILLWLGWPDRPFPWVMFFAFVPLLILEERLSSRRFINIFLFIGYAYLTFVTWNILTTWWICNSTLWGGIFAITANAGLMCAPLILFFITKYFTNTTAGLLSFALYYISFEYWHLNWDLSWPWLTLGNAFATQPYIIQWYEYTGVFGGSLWILLSNVLIFSIVRNKNFNVKKPLPLFLTFWILLPAAISLFIYFNHEEKGSEVEVIVVQPNIDPYEEKFSGSAKFIPYEQQLERLISLSEKMIGPETRYVAWPETALPYGYLEDEIEEYAVINQLKSFVEKHKNISLITGLDTYKLYKTKETSSCVYKKSYGVYEDSYNSALYINEKKEIDLYRKSRLVPGVEYMPPSLTEFAIEMGESAGGLGKQDTRTVFFNKDSIGIAPVICYESVFGEFVTDYIKNGANMIFIITNDGWWGNTEGHKQHLLFASLRAIETRKSIARAANTGISGFINQRGDIIARSGYWEQDVLKMKIRQNDEKTFYTMHGDYIAVIVNFGSVLMLIFTLTGYIRKLKRTRGS